MVMVQARAAAAAASGWPFSLGLVLGVLVISFALTTWYRKRAIAWMHLDVPNARSSHTVATPRGGGVAIAVSVLVGFLTLRTSGYLSPRVALGLCAGGSIVAIVGYLDDRRNVLPRWRLLGHFAAAALLVISFNGAPPLVGFHRVLAIGKFGDVLAALYLVWMLNLTNFMDGIDGIAGLEAITICVPMALLGQIAVPAGALWGPPIVLASGTLGFLLWNWPPAKIFMGDVGSGFLGFVLGALALDAGRRDGRLLWAWVIMSGVFVVDATVTLFRRVVGGKKFYEAHRSHAYQHEARRLGRHKPVTIAVGLINLVWLLPIAASVALGWVDGPLGLAVAYVPMILAALRLGAGTQWED